MADDDSRKGSVYFDDSILAWTARVHAPHDEGLQRAFDAPKVHRMPAIQVAPSEGRFTELLLKMIRARTVVEVGTLAGYSALRMVRALPADGHVHTIEFDPRHAQVARDAIAAAGEAHRVTVHVGAGLEVLPTLEPLAPFDAVFVDADKENYDAYGRWAARHLRPGGLLLGDNAFLFGQLLEESPRGAAMRRFHEEAAQHFDSVCVPTPDGLLVGIRKG